MSISAMKCALQSLESVEKVNGWNKDSIIGRHCAQSAHFLRQAIAEAEDAVAAEREACAKVCRSEADRALWNFQNDLPENNAFWNGAEQMASSCENLIKTRVSA